LHGAASLSVGASVGVAMLSGELDAAALIELADKDMYARKDARR
jgi:PleD family two-component response regulator